MTRISHYIRTVLSFVFFAVGGFVLSWMIVPLVRISSLDRDRATRRCQRTLQGGFRLFLWVLATLRLFKTEWKLSESITVEEPSVIVCNHPTLLDTVAMTVRYNDVICLVKRSYYRNPLFYGLLKMCGYVPAPEAGSIEAHQHTMDVALRGLRQGYSILAFPETRRSSRTTHLPFRRGPIEIAARAEVPIVPVRLSCTPPTLAREIPLHTMPLECVLYQAEQLPKRAAPQGRTNIRAATRAIQNLLQVAEIRAPGDSSPCFVSPAEVKST